MFAQNENLPHGIGLDHLNPDPEEVAACYEQQRTAQGWISAACLLAYQKTDGSEAKAFGQQLCQCCQPPVARNCPQRIEKGPSCDFERPEASEPRGSLEAACLKAAEEESNLSEKGTPVKGMSQVYSDMIAPAASNPAQGLYEAMLGN